MNDGGDLRGSVGPRRRRGVPSLSSFFSFRGSHRALQDLYEDWSAIYRNRIPPYLTLPLARSSLPPSCLAGYSLPISSPLFSPLASPRPPPCPFALSFFRTPPCRFYSVAFAAPKPLSPSFRLLGRFLFVPLVSLCPSSRCRLFNLLSGNYWNHIIRYRDSNPINSHVRL